MNFPFHRERRTLEPVRTAPASAHQISSEFSTSSCRFVLDCTCGAHFDTPYIDEALEIRELHMLLAPLSDQLAS